MPLSKQAKALYEAALRRKGLQPGKAVRQDPRTFVGPIRMQPGYADVSGRPWHPYAYEDVMRPADTYWNDTGRFQDLEDELAAAIKSGRWERTNPNAHTYYRYYNDGDIPHMPGDLMNSTGSYNAPDYKYYVSRYDSRGRYLGEKPHLTRLGELELEARADEATENDYKNYLRQMYGGKIRQRPPRYGVRVWDRMTHEPLVSEYDELDDALKGLRRNREDYGSAYLEEIWPEE
jgi:hypothetical protein